MHGDPMLRWKIAGLAALAAIVLSVPLHAIKERRSRAAIFDIDGAVATYVGSDGCIDCHEEEYRAWRGSDHDKSMAVATDTTVLGDFDNTVFQHGDIYARFYTKDRNYFVYTQGPNGELTEFEVAYTLGHQPFQQYLVPFTGGRLQALSIAWDTERGAWYYMYPDSEIERADWLHWTRGGQTWNSQCAECHSTNLKKNYDAEERTYSTTWSEINVGCEACHGPGSRHVEWAEIPAMARVSVENYELLIRTSEVSAAQEVELCAPCHSRRTVLGDYDHTRTDLLQDVVPSLLTEDLYFADGQIQDEVYDYGSFVQSKMYREGVRCGDCHDAHNLELLEEGNALCLRCHRASTYDAYDHHFHQREHEGRPSDGYLCVSCHMPERPYWVVDYRADHSMPVPRPDLTLQIGVPNACSMSGCHADRPVEWSADHFLRWYGEAALPHYGTTLAAARESRPEAGDELVQMVTDTLYPAIVRATALLYLNQYSSDEAAEAVGRALKDGDALVRHTAVENLGTDETEKAVELVAPLLSDQVMAVRLAAAIRLAGIPAGGLQDYQREALDAALHDFRDAMANSQDQPHAAFNLGNLHMSLRDTAGAELHYRAAIEINDTFYPAKLNLAALLVGKGMYEEAESLLRDVLVVSPDTEEAAYALGQVLAETGRYEEAIEYLQEASAKIPERSSVFYDLAVMEDAVARRDAAESHLQRALDLEPDNLDYLHALAGFYVKYGELARALDVAERMMITHPDNETGAQVKMYIEEMMLRSAPLTGQDRE